MQSKKLKMAAKFWLFAGFLNIIVSIVSGGFGLFLILGVACITLGLAFWQAGGRSKSKTDLRASSRH